MAKEKDFESLKNNVIEDLERCSNRDLNRIYNALKKVLKDFDRDGFWKNLKDSFKQLFKDKKERCILFIDDICDSKDKLTKEEKEQLRKAFLDVSNIYRTFLEDIQALFGAL